MAKSRYLPDHSRSSGMGGFMLNDGGLQDALLAVAERGKVYAETFAPVGKTGHYAASFSVTKESGRPDTVGATIVNDADYAAHVEFDLTHTLAKTADYLNAGLAGNRKVRYTTKAGKIRWATKAQVAVWTRGKS